MAEQQQRFFDSYEFLWGPQRPQRTKADIERALRGLSPEAIESAFTFEDRVAVRSLLYCVMDEVNLRNVLDGLMLPPPYSLLDLTDRRWTAADLAAIVSVLDPALDGLVVQLPFNLALRLGSYDARLRAASRRLCWVLGVPFSIVEAREEEIAQLQLRLSSEGGAGGGLGVNSLYNDGVLAAGPATSGGAGGAPRTEQGKQEEIAARKEERKRSLKRVATVGGFAVLGGAALVLTGGLVAPLVAPAFATLVTATTVTLGAIGSIGTAVLGGGALAGIFTAIIGVGTHAAALASVITPVLTAANVTAIFGAGGATLAGYKAVRRTSDSDTFMIRSIDEMETFTGAAAAAEEDVGSSDAVVAELAESSQAVGTGEGAGLLGTKLDLTSVVEDDSKPGLVIPSHTRSVGMANVSSMRMVKKRNRFVVFGIDSALTGYELRLKAVKLTSGVWGMVPPTTIPAGSTGICASMNRYMHPTGTGFVLCYLAEPVEGKRPSASFRLWVRVDYDFLGGWQLGSFCEGIDREFDPFKAEMRLETDPADGDYIKTQIGVTMAMRRRPFTYLRVYPAAESAEHARKVTFPVEELAQRQLEYAHDVRQRRKVGVSLVNNSRHMLYITDAHLVNGAQWAQTASPMMVEPHTASLTFFTNDSWSLEGAEGYYIVQIDNTNERPLMPKYYVRLQFEISALNNLNVAVACAPSARELQQMELTPATPPSLAFPVETKPGLFCGLSVRLLVKDGIVELRCDNAVERDAGVQVVEKASLTIGVCGYSGVFDARRPMQDQQVGLWQPVLRSAALLAPSESYALQWEDDYLAKFGETIKVDFQLADAVGKKALSTATSVAKKQLTQGVIFSGFRAFNSFLGAFSLPLYAVWASDVIDNTYATLSNRAVFAGKDLATALLGESRGNRPVSLVGFSFGSKVIAECLKELAKVQAFGVVENVYLLGATFPADRKEWQQLRRVVAGRLVNVYTRSDWALWLMYKANEGDLKPMAGITPVSVAGVENVDASAVVQQHSGYALRLGEVIDLIPRCPTADTWGTKGLRGSPGVIVPTTTYRKTLKTMSASLGSALSSRAFSAFALRNGIVSDVADFSSALELVAVSTFHCFFDFLPPASVDAGCAGVFGVIGEESGQPIGGVFSFRLRLDPFCDRDLLLIVPFYAERNSDISITVRPSLILRRSTRGESEEEAEARFYAIATQAVTTLDDARASTLGATPSPSVLSPGVANATVTFEVPFDTAFLDGHRHAAFRVSLSKGGSGGVAIHVLALANRAASQLQQERFTPDVYDKKYASAAEAAAKAALGLGDDAGTGGAGESPGPLSDAAAASGKTSSTTAGIAEVESLEHLQSALYGIAASLPAPSGGTPGVATSEEEGGGKWESHAGADAVVVARSGKFFTLPDIAFIVVANCGEVPLFYSEQVLADGAAHGAGDRSSGHASLTDQAFSPSMSGSDNVSGEALDRSTSRRRQRVQWTRFPPPKLPPQSFCVVSATHFAHGAFPAVRYETADGVCAFDMRATAPLQDTPLASFAGPPSPESGTGTGAGADRLVVCSVAAPLAPRNGGTPADDDVGSVSTSTTVVRDVRFHLVLMTPKSAPGGRTFRSSEADEAVVKTVLKSYGWFIS